MDFKNEESFGDRLTRYRAKARKSQQYLADCLHVSRGTIVKWEQKSILPKDWMHIEEIVQCLHLKDAQREALFKAALLPLPHFIQNLSYHRNPFFTGRDQELERLHVQLQQKQTATIGQMLSISGLGGIGKTQLAVEYAYRYHEMYQYVLWARAESVEALNTSYSKLARLLSLPEQNVQEQEEITQALKHWLQNQHGWLLILDNADNPALLPDFLPPTVGGHVLITTRVADLSSQLVDLAHLMVLGSFTDEQGGLFLLHRAHLLPIDAPLQRAEVQTRHLAMDISFALGGLPLALDQAGAYLSATGSSLAGYQQRSIQLLYERGSTEYPEPVTTTWNRTFEQIKRQNPAAADLLQMLAFLAAEAIPEIILTKSTKGLSSVLAPVVSDANLLNEAIEVLCRYSLVNRDPSTQTLSVHSLVQTVLRNTLSYETRQQWMQCVIAAVEAACRDTDVAHWVAYQRLLPHALVCATMIEVLPTVNPEAAILLERIGYYLCIRGRYREAEPLYQQALALYEQYLGEMHLRTADCLNPLASLYQCLGKYEEAEPLYKRALAIYELQLETSQSKTTRTLYRLATLYQDQEKHEEAERHYKRALALYEQYLGEMHPDTANLFRDLAMFYQDQGRYEEAERLYQRALAIYEQYLGEMHPDTTQSLTRLMILYFEQNKNEEAKQLYKRVLAIHEQYLREEYRGVTHSDTAKSLRILALFDEHLGKDEEAERHYKRALVLYEQYLGETYPDTANLFQDLAMFYQDRGKYEEAERLYQRALAIYEQYLGEMHPRTAEGLDHLAMLYQNRGKYKEAERLYQRALAIYERQLDVSQLKTARILHNLAHLYKSQYRYSEAEPLYMRALAIREQQLEPNHLDIADSLNSLALLYSILGRYNEAKPLFKRALSMYRQTLGLEHPRTQTIFKQYITLLRTIGHKAETKKLEEES